MGLCSHLGRYCNSLVYFHPNDRSSIVTFLVNWHCLYLELLLFNSFQAATYEMGTEIRMQRDTKAEQMKSSALSTPADILKGGDYKVVFMSIAVDTRYAIIPGAC